MSVDLTVNTHAMLDALLSRWRAAPERDRPVHDGEAEHMRLAHGLLADTLVRYLPWLDAHDAALYERLQQARNADELSELFLRCFDLMVRVRGAAVAVLRAQELFRLLRPHITR
jgi:hypothetical protein